MGGSECRVRNPRTGEVDYRFVPVAPEPLAEQCKSLRVFQKTWAARSVGERADVLLAWRERLQANREPILEALCLDTGRMKDSIVEFDTVLRTIERWCREAPPVLQPEETKQTSIPFLEVMSQSVPLPLVGVISPWNLPLLLSLIDAIPALITGCAVVIKPSEITPRFIEPLAASIAEVPALAAVLSFVPGDGITGAALIASVDVICFTGSVATGRKVGEAAARAFIPSFLELGGKDPAIVLEDADIERTAAAICWGGLANAGQACLSLERIYVQESIYDTFVDALVRRVSALRFCSGEDLSVGEIGPVIAERQAAIIQSHLDDAVAKGAALVCGGQIRNIGGGLWCEPTVLANVDHRMKVMTEETFGPILPVMAFATPEQALALANDSPLGLSAAVFSANHDRALALAEQLEAGAISVNDCSLTAFMHEGEKQSFKLSGMGGSRMGISSLRRFVRKKVLIQNRQQLWDPWWFHGQE